MPASGQGSVRVLVIAEMEKVKAEIDAIIDAAPGRGS